MGIEEIAQRVSEEIDKNKECFVSAWIKANPTANISEYRLEYSPYYDNNNMMEVVQFRIVKEKI